MKQDLTEALPKVRNPPSFTLREEKTKEENTTNEEDLKHVGNIKDLLYMRVFKNGFTAAWTNKCHAKFCMYQLRH